jgi:hypothetical protein
MGKKIWNVTVDSKSHEVVLNHGYWSGKRQVFVDGNEVQLPVNKSRMLLDFGNTLPFEVAGKNYEIQIKTNGITFSYHLHEQGQAGPQPSQIETDARFQFLLGEIVTSEQANSIIKETSKTIIALAVLGFVVAFFLLDELRISGVVLFTLFATWLYKRPSTVPILGLVLLTIVSMVTSSIASGGRGAPIYALVLFWLLFRSYQAVRFLDSNKSSHTVR